MSKILSKNELKPNQLYWIMSSINAAVPCHYTDNEAHNGYIYQGIAYTTREEANNHKDLSAKEMFEELGYKQDTNTIGKHLSFRNSKRTVVNFFEKSMIVQKYGNIYADVNSDNITVKEHLAIHQQMKELGWIE